MFKNLVVTVFATPVVSICLLAADPMVGIWKLNNNKSKFDPAPGPQSQTIKVEESGDDLRVTVETITSDGKPMQFSYTVRKDGKDHPITSSPFADANNWTRIDERTTDMVAKKNGKEVSRTHVVVARDGQSQTISGYVIDAEGEKTRISSIYDKQ